jgi:hypothetical protein
MTTAPIADVFADMSPSPRVRLTLDEFEAGTEYVTILRDGDEVAGAVEVRAAGGVIRTDYHAPFNTVLTYRAAQYNSDMEFIAYTSRVFCVVPWDGVVFSDPADPKVAVEVRLSDSAGANLFEGVEATVHALGERRIVIASASATGLDDLNMDFYTDTITDYRKVVQLFKQTRGVILVRTPPPIEVPRVLYAWGIPRRQEVSLAVGLELFDHQLTLQQVSAPSTRVVAGVITYARFRSVYTTYRDFLGAYLTYRDALTTPPDEGQPPFDPELPLLDTGDRVNDGVELYR